MIRENPVCKYEVFYGVLPEDRELKIIPEKEKRLRKQHSIYNHFFIKEGYRMFRLCGSEEMLQMALLAGIGARNGIGIGAWCRRR